MKILTILGVLISITLAFLVFILEPYLTFSLLLVFCLLLLTFINIENSLLIITLLRASLDVFRDVSRISFGSISLNITGSFSLLIICLGIIYFLLNKNKITFFRLLLPLFIFLVICALSIFYSPHKVGSLQELVRLSSYFILAWLIADVFNTKQKIQRFMGYFIGALVIPLTVSFWQHFANAGSLHNGYNRLVGTLRHPSSYGKFLVLYLIIFLVFLIFRTQGNKIKNLSLVSIGVLFFQIVYTYSRSVWIQSFIGVFVLCVLTRKKALIFILVGLIVVFSTTPLLKNRFKQEISNSSDSFDIFNSEKLSGSNKSRFEFNEFALKEMFFKSPLFGKGIGSFYYYYSPRKYGVSFETHGDLTKLLGEVGLLGTLTFYYGMLNLIKYFHRAKIICKDPFCLKIIISFLCLLYIQLFAYFFDANIRLVITQWYFWSFCGLAMACSKIGGSNEIDLKYNKN